MHFAVRVVGDVGVCLRVEGGGLVDVSDLIDREGAVARGVDRAERHVPVHREHDGPVIGQPGVVAGVTDPVLAAHGVFAEFGGDAHFARRDLGDIGGRHRLGGRDLVDVADHVARLGRISRDVDRQEMDRGVPAHGNAA